MNMAYFICYQHLRGDNPPWPAIFYKPIVILVIWV